MPRINAANVSEHRALVQTSITDALERILADRPLSAITLAQVAQEAGIVRNTIYNYAPDVSSLVTHAAYGAGLQLATDVAAIAGRCGSASDRLGAMIAAVLTWFAEGSHRRIVAESLFGDRSAGGRDYAAAPLEMMIGDVARVLNEGQAAGEFRGSPTPEFVLELISSVMHAAVVRVIEGGTPRATIEAEVSCFLIRALRP